ncbi:MAG: DUF2207 domain-containing protein [Patescibacteria group bacterium]|nr:DUF2207 domain-containing protein [Patescibacteria group bacterium]
MKKYLSIFVILGGLLLAWPVLAQEQIDNYDVTIQMNKDATINVSERIQYDFGAEQKHGIFRYIPIKYKARGGNFNLRISDISVIDGNGFFYNTEITYPGNDVSIKIGEADVLVSGKKTYIIDYTIRRAINYFEDHDELYWNVTGNEWPVPIVKSSAAVILPVSFDASQIMKSCFSGPFGSTASCAKTDLIKNNENGLVKFILFSQNELKAGEGLTIVAGLPVGSIAKPTWQQNITDFLSDNKALFLPLLVLLACFIYWYWKGRDPKGRVTIIAEYEAPDDLTPSEVGTIIDEMVNKKDVSAEIINLAVLGYLKIKREISGTIIKKPVYTLLKLKSSDGLLPHQKKLMDALFSSDKQEVALSNLSENFYKKYEELVKDIYALTVSKGYFPASPQKVRQRAAMVLALILGAVYLFTGLFSDTLGFVGFIISIIIVEIFAFRMPRKTLKGVLTKEKILGLKEFLMVTEKDRIKFHNAPEKSPELFEKFLPYAMVLGVETQWAKQFESIYKTPPSWYQGTEGANFNSILFVSSLHNFQAQTNSALFTAPSSAAGGASGFSGGGSGGGFGGGGGGSW